MKVLRSTERDSALWQPNEYVHLIHSLLSEDCAGVLLVGEIGSGKSMLVRNLLHLSEVPYVTVRLLCSAALSETPYGALAPLLTDIKDEINDVSAIRESLREVNAILATDKTANKVLMIVEDGHYIDSASAFVLAQMVRSGDVKLLVLSNEVQQDSISSEVLMSVAQLARIRLEPMTAGEIQRYGSEMLGTQISDGSARIIHDETAGLHALVREYVQMAIRQGAFQTDGIVSVLSSSTLVCDTHAADEVSILACRYNPQFRELLELMIMTGGVPMQVLRRLGLHQTLQRHPSALIRVSDGAIGISSTFFAEAIRLRLPPGRNIALFELARPLRETQQSENPDFALWALSHGEQIPVHSLQVAIQTLIERNQYSAAERLLGSAGTTLTETARSRATLQILFGLHRTHGAEVFADSLAPIDHRDISLLSGTARTVLDWLRDGEGASGRQSKSSGNLISYDDEPEDSIDTSGHVADRLAIAQCDYGLQRFLNADLDHVPDHESIATNDDFHFLLPRISYRLGLLITQVRTLIESAEYSLARKKLEEFELRNSFEVAYACGSLHVLKSLVDAKSGKIAQARVQLRNAEVELQLQDPHGLYSLCGVVDYLITEDESRRPLWEFCGGTPADEDVGAKVPVRTVPTDGGTNKYDDYLVCAIFSSQRSGSIFTPSINRTLARLPQENIIQRTLILYQVWLHTEDESLKQQCVAALRVLQIPSSCIGPLRLVRLVEVCQAQDPESMRDYAEELYNAGDPVPALEMMSQLVQLWSLKNDSRRRGMAIRKVHEWLVEIDQEPWGIVSRTLSLTGLTSRENEIVELVRQGLSNREISRVLTVSQRTVEGHLYRVFAKMGVTQRSELFTGDH